ncbi:hypothetical protein K431DRAFT_145734 [Polychaeton citri CBS 116435]|uniref:Uncharacterized protein n=1 Tax=Polychaeton citri CBS 116435 TaxID=1314669 RepID=A0A9P4QET1_9PEZI|nr:hypothetical protein K431DRAFT_145734 [Polychaeton citri CBS 116435]
MRSTTAAASDQFEGLVESGCPRAKTCWARRHTLLSHVLLYVRLEAGRLWMRWERRNPLAGRLSRRIVMSAMPLPHQRGSNWDSQRGDVSSPLSRVDNGIRLTSDKACQGSGIHEINCLTSDTSLPYPSCVPGDLSDASHIHLYVAIGWKTLGSIALCRKSHG